jgi:FMN phosphatase YigB (HAD superfamily)
VVLSYEAGVEKPDPRIFALACERLGIDPHDAVMVGDNEADGGGEGLGIRTYFVEPLHVDQRPTALADIVEQVYSAG